MHRIQSRRCCLGFYVQVRVTHKSARRQHQEWKYQDCAIWHWQMPREDVLPRPGARFWCCEMQLNKSDQTASEQARVGNDEDLPCVRFHGERRHGTCCCAWGAQRQRSQTGRTRPASPEPEPASATAHVPPAARTAARAMIQSIARVSAWQETADGVLVPRSGMPASPP